MLENNGAYAHMRKEDCSGCDDDFYNGKNPYNVNECYKFKHHKVVTRYRLSNNVPTNIREAYVKVRVPECYMQHRNGFVYFDKIPDYAKTKEQREAEKCVQQQLPI
jgi:hypothetical protein